MSPVRRLDLPLSELRPVGVRVHLGLRCGPKTFACPIRLIASGRTGRPVASPLVGYLESLCVGTPSLRPRGRPASSVLAVPCGLSTCCANVIIVCPRRMRFVWHARSYMGIGANN